MNYSCEQKCNTIKKNAYSLVQFSASRGLHVSKKCGLGSPTRVFITSHINVKAIIPIE